MRIWTILNKAHDTLSKLLNDNGLPVRKLVNDNGRQSELKAVIEYTISVVICLNVALMIGERMESAPQFITTLSVLKRCFFIFFLFEYILRVWVADIGKDGKTHAVTARLQYIFSWIGMIDLLALSPAVFGIFLFDFRVFRILKLLRLMRIKGLRRYTETLAKVVRAKGSQLLASLLIVSIFTLACSIVVYDIESAAQPEVFDSVLSSLWWAIAAITTIGYGDIYPITPLGKIVASTMSILGILLMAIPTAILTSGFYEESKNNQTTEITEPKNPDSDR